MARVRCPEAVGTDLRRIRPDIFHQTVLQPVDPAVDGLIASDALHVPAVAVLQVPASVFGLHGVAFTYRNGLRLLREAAHLIVDAVPDTVLLHGIACDVVGDHLCLIRLHLHAEQDRKTAFRAVAVQIIDPPSVKNDGIVHDINRFFLPAVLLHLHRKDCFILFPAVAAADDLQGAVIIKHKILVPELPGSRGGVAVFIHVVKRVSVLQEAALPEASVGVPVTPSFSGLVPAVKDLRLFILSFGIHLDRLLCRGVSFRRPERLRTFPDGLQQKYRRRCRDAEAHQGKQEPEHRHRHTAGALFPGDLLGERQKLQFFLDPEQRRRCFLIRHFHRLPVRLRRELIDHHALFPGLFLQEDPDPGAYDPGFRDTFSPLPDLLVHLAEDAPHLFFVTYRDADIRQGIAAGQKIQIFKSRDLSVPGLQDRYGKRPVQLGIQSVLLADSYSSFIRV